MVAESLSLISLFLEPTCLSSTGFYTVDIIASLQIHKFYASAMRGYSVRSDCLLCGLSLPALDLCWDLDCLYIMGKDRPIFDASSSDRRRAFKFLWRGLEIFVLWRNT